MVPRLVGGAVQGRPRGPLPISRATYHSKPELTRKVVTREPAVPPSPDWPPKALPAYTLLVV